MALSSTAQAGGLGSGLVDFEDALAFFGPGEIDVAASGLDTFYAADGMTISASEPLWMGNGVSNGDFGTFRIEGSSGPGFLALFDGTEVGGTVTFTFDGPVNFLIDLIITSVLGTQPVECTVTTMLDGSIVDHEVLTLTPISGDPDGQVFFRLFSNADTFHFQLSPSSNRVLAFDFIEWTNLSCGLGDINQDGFLNFGDISAFLLEYGAGCNE